MEERIKEIHDLKTILVEKNRQEKSMEKVYQNVEYFFDRIEDQWGKLKVSFPLGQQPKEFILFSEDLANYFLDHIDFYFNHINKNHTMKLDSLLGKVERKLQGIEISDRLKHRLKRAHQNTSWHGH